MRKKKRGNKKKIILIILAIMIVGVGYMLISTKEGNAIGNMMSSFNHNSQTEQNKKKEQHDLTFIEYGKMNYYDKGYYHIEPENENDNIKYFDYSAKKEIYLCNKPNCKHDTNECSSYVDFSSEAEMFVYEEHIYLISAVPEQESAGNSGTLGLGVVNYSSPKIYQMNLDGTNKTKIFETPSGVKMSRPYIIQGNILYAFFTKSKNVSIGTNTTSQVQTEKKLVQINLETGKYKELLDSKHKEMIGVFQDNIVLAEIIYPQDPNDFIKDDSGYLNNLNRSKMELSLFHTKTNQETVFLEDSYPNLQEKSVFGDCVYYIGKNSKKLEYVNMQTKEKGVVKELPKTSARINGIYDNKLLYSYDPPKNQEGVDSAYYVDLTTKENKAFTLFTNLKDLVEILSQNEEYYFVRTGYDLSAEYKTWAGTTQRDVKNTHYGLIRKQDYWNSKGNYIKMENAK